MNHFAQQDSLFTGGICKIWSYSRDRTPQNLRKHVFHQMHLSDRLKILFKNVTESNYNGVRTCFQGPNFHAFPPCKEFCCMKSVIWWQFSCNKILCTVERHESWDFENTSSHLCSLTLWHFWKEFSIDLTNAFSEKHVCEGFVVCGLDCNFKFCIFHQWKENLVAQND